MIDNKRFNEKKLGGIWSCFGDQFPYEWDVRISCDLCSESIYWMRSPYISAPYPPTWRQIPKDKYRTEKYDICPVHSTNEIDDFLKNPKHHPWKQTELDPTPIIKKTIINKKLLNMPRIFKYVFYIIIIKFLWDLSPLIINYFKAIL